MTFGDNMEKLSFFHKNIHKNCFYLHQVSTFSFLDSKMFVDGLFY